MCRDVRAGDKTAGHRDLPFHVLSPKIKESAVRAGPLSYLTALQVLAGDFLPTEHLPRPHTHTPVPRECLLVLSKDDQPGVNEDQLLGGFTLLPVGQEVLLPQPLAISVKWDTSPRGGKHRRGKPKITVPCVLLEWDPSDQPALGGGGVVSTCSRIL